MPSIQTKPKPAACPQCHSTYTIKKGKRRNRLQMVSLFQCGECEHRFTSGPGRNRTYPLKLVLEAISTFNLGHSLTNTQRILRRQHLDIPEGTIRSWIVAHKPLASFWRLRNTAKRLFSPDRLVRTVTMQHQQVYRFQVHQAESELLLQAPAHERFSRLKRYLVGMSEDFPHHLFQNTQHRSSRFPAELTPEIARKENHATRLAALVLPTAPNNKKRHETLQRFMLINDSVTVAVEIPVYLTRDDVSYYRSRGFNVDLETDIITGHIDLLQVRNGYLHILDYKPEARREKHAHVQLTIYALALSRRIGLPLKDFKCAWFDEYDYFEYFPLNGVYSPKNQTPNLPSDSPSKKSYKGLFQRQ